MEFRYGISPRSLARWQAFERICAIQAQRGCEVGRSVLERIVAAELQAIERATTERRSSRLHAIASRASVQVALPLQRQPRPLSTLQTKTPASRRTPGEANVARKHRSARV